jgi:hypothetical protein
LWQAHTGSRVVLVPVPAGWGRSTVLARLAARITSRDDAPVTFIVRVNGQDLPSEPALQAQVLRACLSQTVSGHRLAALPGLDELSGQAALALGVGALFLSGPAAGVSFLLAGLAVNMAGRTWDVSPAGQDGALARTARAVAAVSVEVPVVVIIDDADCLDEGLAVTLVDDLTARYDSQVLIVAAVAPGSAVRAALTSRVRSGMTTGLVRTVEADPDMGYESRLQLARQLCPNLPDAATRRIARRTTTFADVFTVAGAPRLGEISRGEDDGEVLAVVEAAVNARPAGAQLSGRAHC